MILFNRLWYICHCNMSKLPTPFTFSQSSLQDYADCPRRFQLRYIERLEWPAVDAEPVVENERHQIEGQLFHRLVQQHLLGVPSEKLFPLADSPTLARWWDHFNVDLSGFDLHPELTLSSPIGNHRLVAKYDLVAVQPERAVIYDWKTYGKRPRDEWMSARWQTRVYRALLAQAGAHLNGGRGYEPGQIEMSYWYADFPSEPTHFKYDAHQFKRDGSALERVVEEIANGTEFPLTEDEKMCRFCAFRSYCNRGTQAGQTDEAEAEVESESAFDINFEQIGEIEF